MSRVRLLVAGVLALLAVGAVAASSASAEPTAKCEPNGTTKTLTMGCVENAAKELLVLGLPSQETIVILSSINLAKAPKLVASNGLEVVCNGANNTGVAAGNPTENLLIHNLIVEFTECTAPKPEHCIVMGGAVKTESLDAHPTGEDGFFELLPTTGKKFAKLPIESSGGTCLAEGSFTVEGSVVGKVLEPETDKEVHLFEFEKAKGLTLTGGITSELTLVENLTLDRPSTWNSTKWAANPPWGLFLTEKIS